MPRNLDATLAADMASASWAPVILASLAFRSKTEYVWSGRGTLAWNGNSFTGVGSLGKIGAIGAGAADVAEDTTSVELSGIDADLLGESMTDCTPRGAVSIWLGSWLGAGLHGTPYLLFQGYMGQPTATPDIENFIISLQLQTSLAQLNRASCRRYTADQRLYYPDDTAFNWVEIQNDLAERWADRHLMTRTVMTAANAAGSTPAPRVARVQHWATRAFHVFLIGRARTPFAWGTNDCAMFAADGIKALIGVDIAADFRGKYTDEVSAMSAIKTIAGGSTIADAAAFCAQKHGLVEWTHPLLAKRGDLAVVSESGRLIAGLVHLNGAHVVSPGDRGLLRIPITAIVRSWHV